MAADAWREHLSRDLQARFDEHGVRRPLPLPMPALVEIELVLTLMHDHFPGQDAALGWTLVNGHRYPAYGALGEDGQRAVATARLHLTRLVGRSAWERHLEAYQALEDGCALYAPSANGIAVRLNALLAEQRLSALRHALRTPPERPSRRTHYAPAGRYRFTVHREPQEVEITEAMAAVAAQAPGHLFADGADDNVKGAHEPLRVPRDALLQEAVWMDANAAAGAPAAGQWEERLSAVRLCLVTPDGLAPCDELVLDGTTHLPGMVGSGKSTLLIVLTVYLARRGYRVTLVESDVASLMREHAIFEALAAADPALHAVPLIGQTTRADHLRRLHVAETLEAGRPSLGGAHPGYAMLSTVCPLDGARRDVAPIPPGVEPCGRLHPVSDDGMVDEDHACDCPFLPVCPVHLPTRLLPERRIWLATPASLLASGPQGALLGEAARNVEVVMRESDVVLVDEADLVQVQYDTHFAPHEVLIGGPDAWLDRLGLQVSRHMYRPGRPLIGRNRALDRWLDAHQNVQRAADYLYRWLRESDTGRRWLSTGYFSRRILLDRVQAEMAAAHVNVDNFGAAADAFLQTPLGAPGDPDSPAWDWRLAANGILATGDPTDPRRHLGRCLRAQPGGAMLDRPTEARLADRLLVALVVTVLDHSLQELIWGWPAAAEHLELDRGNGGLFYEPSPHLLRLIPETAMGSVLGFQYKDADGRGDGQLGFFHLRGLGRALLYHLHDALRESAGRPGPHVLLTSGTAWAPGSWRYDLHMGPSMILLPDRTDETAETALLFEPLLDPARPERRLSVSGVVNFEDRVQRLRAMVHQLADPSPLDGASMLDRELQLLAARAPHRQRILLVVGSYDEARAVGETLAAIREDDARSEVLTLVREGGDDPAYREARPGTITRSRLKDMPRREGARFLVAPLEAIERGHNIVVGQEAAIGSIYFLVRRMLRPDDFHSAVHQVNAWTMRALARFDAPEATRAGLHLRQAAHRVWDDALSRDYTWRAVAADDALAWTLLVPVWQTIGRALRGGVAARIHFIDAEWAPQSARGEYDTPQTSMLLRFAHLLAAACTDPNPMQRAIATTLYGAAARAFANIQGVYGAASDGAVAP